VALREYVSLVATGMTLLRAAFASRCAFVRSADRVHAFGEATIRDIKPVNIRAPAVASLKIYTKC
jgi:hypothetical protein